MEDPHDSLFLRKGQGDSNSSTSDKGAYGLVRALNEERADSSFGEAVENGPAGDDDDDMLLSGEDDGLSHNPRDSVGSAEPSTTTGIQIPRKWQRLLLTPLLPDDRFVIYGVPVVAGVKTIRLLKFTAFTWIGLILMFYFVRIMEFEHDSSYSVPDMMLYDGHAIFMDTMFFFIVGRLYEQRGIDHAAWMLVAFASGLFSSGETKVQFLQYSVSMYSIYCLWPWQLWLFVVVVIGVAGLVIFKHLQYMFVVDRRHLLGIKIFEMTSCVLLFLVPLLDSPYFHFHHWFAGWLVGMHCNFDVWWSRLTMAWCWGAYINGIAVYGRDPLLTCGYSFFLSYGDHCPYLQCYMDAMHNKSHSHYKPMEPQQWWNCTADDYKP